MNDAHQDELNRVAESKEKEVTAKYQPQIETLKAQLTDRDTRLSKEIADAQASKKEVQNLQQQVTDQANKLATMGEEN